MELVAEWLSDLRTNYAGEPLISDVRVGVFYTAVEITTADVGVAFTPRDLSDTVCCPKTAAGAPPAGRLIGTKAWETARYALAPSPLRRALGIATLNALSAAASHRYGLPEGVLHEKLDAMAAAQISSDDEVVMVGTFVPFIKALKGRVKSLRVVDKHPEALKPSERHLWAPPERAAEALARATVVIISGSALVEGGIDELLDASGAARVRVMAGPTTPLWPRPFFRRGIGVLGGIRVLHGRDLVTLVGQGGSGYFFEKAAQKACVIDPSIDFSAVQSKASSSRAAMAFSGR
ncbi:MAG: Rossmann-like domain-containing protein [Candidatus Binataceae bacterium]